MVPWSRGQDFAPGQEFDPISSPLNPGVRSALIINLLTEDNLPHYFKIISDRYGTDDVWGEWSRRWTAEEGRHSIVLRDYLAVTRSVDLRELERMRMAQVSGGVVPDPATIMEGIVYVAMQELATRVAHRKTGTKLDDEAGKEIMKRVAADENLHHLFYRDLVSSGLEIDPDSFVIAIQRQRENFAMPGTGIQGFEGHASAIAQEGIFGLQELMRDVFVPTMRVWKPLIQKARLNSEADCARDELFNKHEQMERIILRRQEKKATKSAEQ
jgi:acyl-[acyl-carrier-protein] desaturase